MLCKIMEIPLSREEISEVLGQKQISGEQRKTAPFQKTDYNKYYPSHRIHWKAHLEAYKAYSQRYGTSQSAERIAERGGFGDNELNEFYPEWKNYIIENK